MWPHFINLLGRAWKLFVGGQGTTTLALVTAAIDALASILFTLYFIRRRHGRDAAVTEWKANTLTAIQVTLVVTILVFGPVFLWRIVQVVYEDHDFLVKRNLELQKSNGALEKEIQNNKHFMDVAGGFTEYRLMIKNDFAETPCLIKFTSPLETLGMANMVRNGAGLGSRCSLWGPVDTEMSPDAKKKTEDGMIDGIIVFHARRGREEDAVFDFLKGLLPLRRTYEVPLGSPHHFIWLQFGKNVKWNHEI